MQASSFRAARARGRRYAPHINEAALHYVAVDCAIITNVNPFAVVALDDNLQLGPSLSRRSSLHAASYKDLTLDQAAKLIRVWLCTSLSPHILFRQLEKEPVFHADKQETRLNSIGVCLKLRTAIAAAGAVQEPAPGNEHPLTLLALLCGPATGDLL